MYNVVVATSVEVRALLRAYLDAVALSESIQARIWKAAQLTLAQIRVLRRLVPRPMALGELGSDLGLSATSMTRLIDRLEERGLVERLREDDDRRRVTAALTAAGRDLIATLPLLGGTPIWEAAERLSPEQRERIGEAMREFVSAVREVDRERSAGPAAAAAR
jgi:DNA-binding MarR family transcriptional regulator